MAVAPGEGWLFITIAGVHLRDRWRRLSGRAGGVQLLDIQLAVLRGPRLLGSPRLARAAAQVCDEVDQFDRLTPIGAMDAASLSDRLVDAFMLDLHDVADLSAGTGRTVDVNPLAQECLAWLREHHALPVTVADLATFMGVTKRHIHFVFAAIGLTPAKALQAIRLDHARDLLLADPHTAIADIARSVGLTHLGRFAAAYRERFGELPSQTPTGIETPPHG